MDRVVQVIDSEWMSVRQIGRHGSGPHEYLEPSKLLTYRGDSTLVRDRGNVRLLLITPDAEAGETFSYRGSAGIDLSRYPSLRLSSAGIMLRPPGAADESGFLYSEASPIVATANGTLALADSVAIERWTPSAAARDTVAYLPHALDPRAEIVQGMVVVPGRRGITPFATSPQWAVALDGRVAVVHVDPYRVDVIDPLGELTRGPEIAYEPIRVSNAHKLRWREEREGRTAITFVTPDRQSTTRMVTRPAVEPDWPRHLPPFLSDAVHFASDGMLWIQRTTEAGAPPTFDIVDRAGRVVAQMTLPHGRRLVGFGRGTVYLVRKDEVDLEYLERYRLPGIRHQ